METITLTQEDLIKLGIKRIFPDLSSDIITNIKLDLDENKQEDTGEAYIDKDNKITINRKMAINRLKNTFGDITPSLENSYLIYLYTHESLHFILKHHSRTEKVLKNNKTLIEEITKKIPNFNIWNFLNIEADIELNHIIFNELTFIFEPVLKNQKNEKENIQTHLRKGYCSEIKVHNEVIEETYKFYEMFQLLKKSFDYQKYFTNTHYFEENVLKMLGFFNELEIEQTGGGGGNGTGDNISEKKFQRKIEGNEITQEKEIKENNSQPSEKEKEDSFSKNKLQSDIASKEAGTNSLNSILERIELQEIKKINIKNLLKNFKTTLKSGHAYETIAVPKASALSRKEISPKIMLEEEKDGKIVIVVDTSGSVFSPDIFGRFVKVFEQIIEFTSKENIKVYVIFIDTEIHEVIEIKEKENIKKSLEKFVKNIKGGGGTELNPAIKFIEKDKKLKNAKLIFTITDGYLSRSLMRTKIKNIVLLPENNYTTHYLNGSTWYLF